MDRGDVDDELLEHARRQTKAQETMSAVLMFFVVVLVLGLLVGLVLWTRAGG